MVAEIPKLVLPVNIVSRADVGRLINEVERVDNFLRQAAIREPGTKLQLPKSSRLFDELVAQSKFNMLQETDRKQLLQFLQAIHSKSPVLHISFSTDPNPIFLQKLTTWIRQNMHPYVLLQIGLQPGIGAGCTVRSINKFYDFSLKNKFIDKRHLLTERLKSIYESPVDASVSQVQEVKA